MIPPTQLLAQLRRTLQSAALNGTRSRTSFKSAGHRSDRTKGRKRTGPESSRRVTKLTVREGSPFGDGPGALQRFTVPASPSDSEVTTETEEEDEVEDQDDDDDQDEEGGDGGDNEGGEEGSCSRLSTVQTLLASASIPVPPELTSVTNYHPPPTSVLPHWVITWLTYQSYRMLHAGHPGSIRQLVRSVLESATLSPPLPMPNTQAAWAMLDTVASWYDEKRVDTQFWISSCLTHLLFLGDETPQLVYQWLMEQLELMLHQSDIDRNSSNASRSIGVIHVLLRLGLATVPIPPSVPTALELNAISQSGPPTSAPGPVGGSGPSVANTAVSTNAVNTAPFIAPNLGRRFPAPVNYSGFPLHPADFFGGNPAGAMPQAAAGSMPPCYPQPMQQHPVPGAAPFPLSNQPPRSIFDTGPPQRSGSGPQNMAIGPLPPTVLQPPPPPTSLYPNTVQSTRLSSHRSRRHGVQSQASGPVSSTPATTEWTVCTPTRQPASLVWLLNLAKLLRLTSVTALARALSLLSRESTQCADIEHRLSRTIDYCQLSTESPVLFHLATQILLTAPGIFQTLPKYIENIHFDNLIHRQHCLFIESCLHIRLF
ncbi:hypothetical protein FGIG_09174 [Fasciola gigantica]|uniref:Uncharacterized protein n=1 Tax=Fasciola gigantica TaxID=46835 RepID=A0A504YYS2_FASGI|nr:hypothetical protein FGIG_09174 [Fasciola gigantica]